jgi:hypothetical protein
MGRRGAPWGGAPLGVEGGACFLGFDAEVAGRWLAMRVRGPQKNGVKGSSQGAKL